MTPQLSARSDFEADPSSVRAVRRFVAQALKGFPGVDDVVLAASELASNVVKHARTPYRIKAEAVGERVRLEVSDGTSILPAVEELSESKRGLRIIEALSDQWGVELSAGGKTVWVEFSSRPL